MPRLRDDGEPIWSTETDYYERYSDIFFPLLPFFHHGMVGNSAEEFLAYILSKLNLRSKSRLIDLGCGSGYFVAEVTKRGAEAIGISTSPACIRGCRDRYSFARFELANMETFVLPGATHATAMESLGYADIEKTLSCVARSLLPGGLFFVNDTFQRDIVEDEQQRANREYYEYYWKYKVRRVDEFIAQAYRHGFRLLSFTDLRQIANKRILAAVCGEHDEVPYKQPFPERGSPVYPVEFLFSRRDK